MKDIDISKVLFIFSCIAGIFTYGMAVGVYEIFPFHIIKNIKSNTEQVITMLGIRPTDFVQPSRYRGEGVTINKQNQASPGLTFITGFFEGGNEMRLVRLDGTVVQRWPVKFFDFFPDPKHIDPISEIPKSEWNVAIHGSSIQPDGSVVFTFTNKGAAKIDRCGNVQWILSEMAHHSVDRSTDGNYWIPSAYIINDKPKYPQLKTPYKEDVVLKISEEGKILKKISVLDILFKNNLQGFVYKHSITRDLVHLNDVEELNSHMAKAFPQFAAGDLMLSMRFPHLVMVVNPETLKLKWYQAGPWLGQHDPDFMDNGIISLFSNNLDGTAAGSKLGGSTIMEINPQTRETIILYGGAIDQPMYTMDRGKHQRVGNTTGNVLITESRSGRIIEVNPEGEVVWEFINRYDEQSSSLVTGAERIPEDYFTVNNWTCNNTQ